MLRVLRSSIPYVARVDNRYPARGGRDAETLTRPGAAARSDAQPNGRAVTAEDFEHLARDAAPGLARVRCVPAEDGVLATCGCSSCRRVGDAGRVPFDALRPAEDDLQRVADVGRRAAGWSAPGCGRAAGLPGRHGGGAAARQRVAVGRRRARRALAALHRFLSPVVGGPDGTGWPFGQALRYGEVFAVLHQVPGVELVEDVRLFPADPVTGARGEAVAERRGRRRTGWCSLTTTRSG